MADRESKLLFLINHYGTGIQQDIAIEELSELQKAIMETFYNRKTHIEEIVAFNDEFIDDKVRIKRWDSFIKKNQIDVYISFKEIMEHIKKLLFPIVKSIIDNYEYNLKWNHRTLNWSINGE